MLTSSAFGLRSRANLDLNWLVRRCAMVCREIEYNSLLKADRRIPTSQREMGTTPILCRLFQCFQFRQLLSNHFGKSLFSMSGTYDCYSDAEIAAGILFRRTSKNIQRTKANSVMSLIFARKHLPNKAPVNRSHVAIQLAEEPFLV
jgi:hypothetical protein